MTYNTIEMGTRIKELRKEKGETQEATANALNLSWSMLSKIERGANAPSLDILVALAQYFETSLDYIVLGEQPKTEQIRENIQIIQKCFENLAQLL